MFVFTAGSHPQNHALSRTYARNRLHHHPNTLVHIGTRLVHVGDCMVHVRVLWYSVRALWCCFARFDVHKARITCRISPDTVIIRSRCCRLLNIRNKC